MLKNEASVNCMLFNGRCFVSDSYRDQNDTNLLIL